MSALTLQSPAKLNLYLKVVGRRPDGYHLLVSLFHRIDLHDTLHLEKRKGGFALKTTDPRLPVDERNLVTRAYQALRARFPKLGGVSVRLIKRIPVGSGLGGGSSNAAAFLLGMKRLYRLRMTRKEWLALAEKLGADVPFFLLGVNQAIAKGIGERLYPRPSKRKHAFILLLSKQGLSTKKVYEALSKRLPAVSLTKVSRAATMLSDFLDRKDYGQAARLLHNDLESAAFRLKPAIAKKIARLAHCGVSTARMSGSGPTVFGILSQEQAAELAQKAGSPGLGREKIVICRTF